MNPASHHLRGRVLRQSTHHGVHLVKPLGRSLNLGVELFVLCVLIVEHGSVLIPLLVRPDRRVFTAGWRNTLY